MDWVKLGQTLLDAGGWAAFLSLVIVMAVGGYRRWWVWGWLWQRSEDRADKSDTQAERNAEALEKLGAASAEQAKAFSVMARSYDRMELRLEALERRRVNRG